MRLACAMDVLLYRSLGLVQVLRFLEDVRGLRLRHGHHAILVGGDDVARVHAHARASDGDVDAGEAEVVDGGGWRDAPAEHRELQPADLRQVANGAVYDRRG